MAEPQPRKTPLYDEHVRLGARVVPFSGWELPVQYTGLRQEHEAVRTAAGIFDVSHMGEIEVRGDAAEDFLNYVITNNLSRLHDGQALYTVMCHEDGGIVDDIIVYRRSFTHFILIVNASNTQKDFTWLQEHSTKFTGVTCVDISDSWALIALQGPRSPEIIESLLKKSIADLKRFHFIEVPLLKSPGLVARTGYTGENGYELMVSAHEAPTVWQALQESGASKGLLPCGLGARDTLRLEMNYPLYGNDIDSTTNPLEAGLSWVVKLKKPEFIGKDRLQEIQEVGVERQRIGFEMLERGVPRHGYKLYSESEESVGHVTSGTHSPCLDKGIGVGYVPAPLATPGTIINVEIRGKLRQATVVPTPFWKPPVEREK